MTKYLKYSLVLSCGICVGIMIVLNDGICHEDLNLFGCKLIIHSADVYLACTMIGIDIILFSGFCYKWLQLLNATNGAKILHEMAKSFLIQFILTIIAMISCVIDAIIHLYTEQYSVKIIFCLDCAIIASCNFAMVKGIFYSFCYSIDQYLYIYFISFSYL